MREMLACALNGQEFLALDPRLYIQDIEEQARTRVETAALAGGGQRALGGCRREGLTVTLRFMVKERDRAARQRVIDRVNAWAGEGWLTCSTRPEQRLYVLCTQPAGSAARKWSEDLQVVFAAYDRACWQERYPVSVTMSGQAGEAELRPMGSQPCCLEAEITNVSGGTVNRALLAAQGQKVEFAGLSLAAGKKLSISYDAHHLLCAAVDGEGRLACRTADSDDDVRLTPGQSNAVRFEADGACDVTLYARGEWA